MPSSQEIAKVMAEMDRFNQSAKVTVTEERYEKRVASVGGSYGGLTALLQQGAPGNWASDHKSEAEKFAGWHYVAISSIGKAVRSANCEAYQEKIREYAKAYNEQDDESEPLPKWHPLMKLLKRPNPSQSGASFREEVAIQLCLTGSALIWNVPNQMGRTVERYVIPTAIAEPRQPERGRPKGGWYINPEVARWQIESGWFLYTGLATAIGKVIDARDVQVIRFIHPVFKDEGQSPVSAGALWTDTSEKVDVSRHSHLRNGSDPSVIIGVDGVEDEGTLQRMSAKFNEKYAGPSKHGKAMFVNAANVKIEPVTRTPAEMAYEGAFVQFRDAIMALHGVTPIAAGIEAPSGDDGLYAPLKQFISGTVQPILDLMAEEDTEQLAGQFGEGISVLYTAKSIDDAKLTEQQINTDIAAGAIEVDEIRKIRGRKPWGGEKGKAVAGQGAKEEAKPGLPGLVQGVPGLETKPNGLEPQTGPQALDPSKPPQGTPDPMKLAEEAVAKALGGFADRLSALLKSGDNCGTGAGGFQEGNTCGQRRAKKGGQVGMNGEFYAGGQFLPSTDMPKKVRADMARIASGKSKVDEGVYETLTPGEFAPYEMIGTFLEKAGRDSDGRLQVRASNDTALAYMGVDTQEKMGQLQSIINRFNAGERKLQIFDYPSFPSAKDIIRALNANLPIPESMLPRLQGNLAKYVTRNGEAAGKAKSDSGYVKLQPGDTTNERREIQRDTLQTPSGGTVTVTVAELPGIVAKGSDCGANGPGGGGFQAGNTCGREDGSEGSGEPKGSGGSKPGKGGKVYDWALEKFKDEETARNFTEWFGDSKVVDEAGNPLVVYHGTSESFEEFDTSISLTEGRDRAAFFSDSSEVSDTYTSHQVLDEKQRISETTRALAELETEYSRIMGELPPERENTFIHYTNRALDNGEITRDDYDRLHSLWDRHQELDSYTLDEVLDYDSKKKPQMKAVYLSLKNPKIINANGMGSSYIVPEALQGIDRTKYDGIIFRNIVDTGDGTDTESTVFAVFRPTAIKSATGNSGKFDPKDPNITKSGSDCGANGPGGGGFQPGNNCGREDGGEREGGSNASAKKKQKATEKEIGKWVQLGTELQRATGWSLSDLMDEAEKQGDRKAQIKWMEKELDSRRSGEFAEARKQVQPHLDRVREKVAVAWDKEMSKMPELARELADVKAKQEELQRKHVDLFLAHRKMRDTMGQSEEELAEFSRLGKEMDKANKDVEKQVAIGRKIWEKKNAIPEKAREKVAEVLRKESLAVMKDISPELASQFEQTSKDMADFVKYDYAVRDAGNSTELDKKTRAKSLTTLSKIANPEIHQDALKAGIVYQDGARASAYSGEYGKKFLDLVNSGVSYQEAAKLSIAPSYSVFSPGSEQRVYVHEYGHQIEYGNREANAFTRGFLESRTKGDKIEPFAEKFGMFYSDDEKGADDNFIHAFDAVFPEYRGRNEAKAFYAGKLYDRETTEILPMGLELFHENPKAFAEADPEWFDLVTGTLTGRLLVKTQEQMKAKYQ